VGHAGRHLGQRPEALDLDQLVLRLLHPFERALQLRVEPGVLEGDPGLRGEGGGDRPVVLRERRQLTAERRQHTQGPVAGPDGDREPATQMGPDGGLALGRVEPGVGGDVPQGYGLASCRDAPDRALPRRQFGREEGIEALAPDLGAEEPGLVDQVECHRVGLEQGLVEIGDALLHGGGRPQARHALAHVHEGLETARRVSSRKRLLLDRATAAWEAREAARLRKASGKGRASASRALVDANGRPLSRLQLINSRTPMMAPSGVFIGTTSIDLVR